MSNQTLKRIKWLSLLVAAMQTEIDDINASLSALEKAGVGCRLHPIIEYRQRVLEEQKQVIEKRAAIIKRISRVDDELYRKILVGRYADGMSCEELAEELHYSNGYVIRLSKRAHAAFEAIP